MLKLPDLILFHILSYLDVRSRLNLSRVSKRLNSLVSDVSSWEFVYFNYSRINKASTHKNKVKKILGDHTKCITFKFKTPTSFRDSWNKISEEIIYILQLCPNLTNLYLYHEVTDVGYMGQNNCLNMNLKDWPRNLEVFSFDSIPKISCLRCLRHKQKLLQNLKRLSIVNCSWFISEDFQFLSPNTNLKFLKITNCFRIFENSSSIESFYQFPNLKSIQINLFRFPDELTGFLQNCPAKRITLVIDEKFDYSEKILEVITHRNYFSSDKIGLDRLVCHWELVESILDLISPKIIDYLSIPFVLEIICPNKETKLFLEMWNKTISTFQIQTLLVSSTTCTKNRKRKFVE